ncbi:hypothetical protein WB401_39990 [Streptomyces brasiliscabiei]|uniref:Uncharacterized protein n=1 Tax=Streptomyces brasiliscabiei TaxID=2736302 RepID=A0ABU8GGG1_9ACTN
MEGNDSAPSASVSRRATALPRTTPVSGSTRLRDGDEELLPVGEDTEHHVGRFTTG